MANREKIWKNGGIRRKTKLRLVPALVFSVFLYSAETWALTSCNGSKINAFEMWLWRKLLRILCTPMRTKRDNYRQNRRQTCCVYLATVRRAAAYSERSTAYNLCQWRLFVCGRHPQRRGIRMYRSW